MRLDFRAPGRSFALAELLERALPDARAEARDGLVPLARIGCDARRVRRPASRVEAGERVVVELPDPPERAAPVGAQSGRAPGPMAAADRFELVALTPLPAWRRGVLEGRQARLRFDTRGHRGAIAELLLALEWPETPRPWRDGADVDLVCGRLADAGIPVLGDTRRGGILVAGGLRLAAAGALPEPWWPTEPVVPGEEHGEPPVLHVSTATARVLRRGHPWVLPDADTRDPTRFAPGTLVALEAEHGERFGLAVAEGPGRIAARVWAPDADRARGAASVEERVARALARRRSILSPGSDRSGETDALRLVHGEADALPGIAVDRLGPLLRVLVTGRASDGFRERAIEALVRQLEPSMGADPPVLEVLHLKERPRGRLQCVRIARGAATGGRLCVRERGLRLLVDPGLDEPERSSPGTGLYLDQRDNRARLARRAARGGRWLNLFAHTGAFSVALLAAGAEEVVSVDLSAAYLRWLDANLAENAAQGVDAGRHRALRHDGRRYLSRLPVDERFAGILVDPPTAAAAGRRFWSVARDLDPLVEQALARLEPGGTLFVSRNDRRRGASLDASVRRCAARARITLREVASAPPGCDFPSLRGFPEGDPFRAVIVTVA